MTLYLYGRNTCKLCEDFKNELQYISYTYIDIDTIPDLDYWKIKYWCAVKSKSEIKTLPFLISSSNYLEIPNGNFTFVPKDIIHVIKEFKEYF